LTELRSVIAAVHIEREASRCFQSLQPPVCSARPPAAVSRCIAIPRDRRTESAGTQSALMGSACPETSASDYKPKARQFSARQSGGSGDGERGCRRHGCRRQASTEGFTASPERRDATRSGRAKPKN
jgi:hypothetical protein